MKITEYKSIVGVIPKECLARLVQPSIGMTMTKILRGCVSDFQAGSESSPTHFFKILMRFDGSPS